MVEFTIMAIEKKVRIRWWNNDMRQEVFLFFKPLKPIKRFRDGIMSVEPLHTPSSVSYQKIYREGGRKEQIISLKELDNTTYLFALFTNKEAEGTPIMTATEYIGTRIELDIEKVPYKRGVEKLVFSCQYSIDPELFWMSFFDGETYGRFHLLPMEKKKERYYTSCLLKEGAYDMLKICLHPDIMDCVHTNSYEKEKGNL